AAGRARDRHGRLPERARARGGRPRGAPAAPRRARAGRAAAPPRPRPPPALRPDRPRGAPLPPLRPRGPGGTARGGRLPRRAHDLLQPARRARLVRERDAAAPGPGARPPGPLPEPPGPAAPGRGPRPDAVRPLADRDRPPGLIPRRGRGARRRACSRLREGRILPVLMRRPTADARAKPA